MAPRGLHHQIVEELGSEIVRGSADPMALATEAIELRFQVSRSVVREALRVLESKGLIRSAPRRGISICPPTDWQLLDSDLIRWRATGADSRTHLTELIELRLGIEPLAARLAARHRDLPALADLGRSFVELDKAMTIQDFHQFVRADDAFHRNLLRASGNALISSMEETIAAALDARARIVALPEDMSPEALDLHRHLYNAVIDGDGDSAYAAALRIVEASYAEVRHAFERLAGDSAN